MHKRIHDLALQAGGSHYPDVGGKTLEKFAELIVKECATVCWLHGSRPEVRSAVLKHFGIDK